MSRDREAAVRALADLSITPALVGLALDFCTDLRCDGALYFQRPCGEPVETTCRARHKHTLCSRCANRGCASGCKRTVCTYCPRQVMVCALCHEEVGICRQCVVPEFSCCPSPTRIRQFICGPCARSGETCTFCLKKVCGRCDIPVPCSTTGCTRRIHTCSLHSWAMVRTMGWTFCSECRLWECNTCARGARKCACGAELCSNCAGNMHCMNDHPVEPVGRPAEPQQTNTVVSQCLQQ